jgi:hypothetical protein
VSELAGGAFPPSHSSSIFCSQAGISFLFPLHYPFSQYLKSSSGDTTSIYFLTRLWSRRSSTMPAPSSSIWTRKVDLLYLIFFVYHISVMTSKPSLYLVIGSLQFISGPIICFNPKHPLTPSSGRSSPCAPRLGQTAIHRRPPRVVCRRVQRPALHQSASLVQRRPRLGSHLPDPAYPVGSTGTVAQ